MSSKYAVWLAFFLNLSFAIVEFIAGGIFVSSAVLADSVHDLGDALAIGLSAFLETISNREEDSRYTLGYKHSDDRVWYGDFRKCKQAFPPTTRQ